MKTFEVRFKQVNGLRCFRHLLATSESQAVELVEKIYAEFRPFEIYAQETVPVSSGNSVLTLGVSK